MKCRLTFASASRDRSTVSGSGGSPTDLAGLTLIDDLSVDRQIGFVTWDAWLENVEKKIAAARSGLKINNFAAVLQGAIDSHGVALARSVLARDDLASGRMLRLFPDVTRPSALAYFVVYWKECASLPKLVAFCEWLLNEAATQSNCDMSRPSASHQMTAL